MAAAHLTIRLHDPETWGRVQRAVQAAVLAELVRLLTKLNHRVAAHHLQERACPDARMLGLIAEDVFAGLARHSENVGAATASSVYMALCAAERSDWLGAATVLAVLDARLLKDWCLHRQLNPAEVAALVLP